ncbi:thermonuclease family protein [Hoeflea prorocentri]|uniref:Thermonuclease family protein n=1 Tax=Hoeflea prorocentri TaxID=1922333 RepID=A0A9X3UNK1_9HYPH|nr:thermonuclease family protein [Hoeflea prorocentri]MCY6382519.1 thermonuclease family protein [Hoeflea prorocentri]MDA5400319.1 thermonuclease family protein [Hoeflea prorocentri]
MMFLQRFNALARPASILIVVLMAAWVLYHFAPDPSARQERRASGPLWSGDAPVETASPTDAMSPRAIAPQQFATPFAQNAAELERIAPRAPLTPQVEPETGPRPTLLHKPLVIAAGEIVFPEGGLRLKGIIVTDPDETCTSPDGQLWPCGIIARTAFRNFIGGRSLSCNLTDDRWKDILVVSCLVGRQDPAAWLASSGWVRTFVGSKYAELEQAAQKEGAGIFGNDPRGLPAVPDSNVAVSPDSVSSPTDPLPVPLR